MKRFGFIATTFLLLFVLVFPFFYFSNFTRAQSLNNDSSIPGVDEQIDITVSPQNPAPNAPVSITLAAYGIDLTRADISWLLNGKVVKNGIGSTQLSLTAGSVGSAQTITIIILPQNGVKIQRQVIIRPASVDITWESSSYTPPFYKGKALYPPEGNLIFVALPNLFKNGVSLSSKNLVYTWSIDGTVLGSKSGYGKNTLSYAGTELDRPFTVEVTAASLDKTIVGQGSLNMVSQQPQLLLYDANPLYGILFNTALKQNLGLINTEGIIGAYPYYFSTNNPSGSVNYKWAINGSTISLPKNQNQVTFRSPEGVSAGQTSVSVEAESSIKLLQSGRVNLIINFQNN